MSDRIGRDRDTGVRGVEIGTRVVKNGAVKILGSTFRGAALARWEGKTVEVGVHNAWATQYTIRNPETLDAICIASTVKEDPHA